MTKKYLATFTNGDAITLSQKELDDFTSPDFNDFKFVGIKRKLYTVINLNNIIKIVEKSEE